MQTVKLVLVLIISIALMLIVVQNTVPVHARFLWFSTEVPVIFLLFLSAVGGFVIGITVALFIKKRNKAEPS